VVASRLSVGLPKSQTASIFLHIEFCGVALWAPSFRSSCGRAASNRRRPLQPARTSRRRGRSTDRSFIALWRAGPSIGATARVRACLRGDGDNRQLVAWMMYGKDVHDTAQYVSNDLDEVTCPRAPKSAGSRGRPQCSKGDAWVQAPTVQPGS
jgi:hypothetical protein